MSSCSCGSSKRRTKKNDNALILLMYYFRSKRFMFLMHFILVLNFYPGIFAMISSASWSLTVGHGETFEVMTFFSGRFVIKWLIVRVFLRVGMVMCCFKLYVSKIYLYRVKCYWWFDVVNILISSFFQVRVIVKSIVCRFLPISVFPLFRTRLI